MNVDVLKAETLSKASGVAFRNVGGGATISVKRHTFSEMCQNDEFEWTLKLDLADRGSRITEAEAATHLRGIT